MKIKFSILLLLISAMLISCYKVPNDTIYESDLDMVITNYQADIDYPKEYMTFAIADSFGLASNSNKITIDDVNKASFRTPIKEAVAANMEKYGYVLTNDSSDVDIYIPITITYVNTKGVAYYPIYSPGYGYGYPGYGYGYGYGGYYYSWSYIPTYFSYDQGSVLINWLDIKNKKAPIAPDTNYRVESVWDMAISGLLSDQPDNDRIKAAIGKGFEQSPYLKK